jgi:hypothetical protein
MFPQPPRVSIRVMLSISRNVWLRGPVATVVTGWLAEAEVALTHEPDHIHAHRLK